MNQDRFQNFFYYNGVKYYTGTIIIVNDYGKHAEATFVCYDTQRSKYVYKVKECTWHAHSNYFQRVLIEVTDKHNPNVQLPSVEKCSDIQIKGLLGGWLIYAFLAVLCIFAKQGFVYLIFISIGFFMWRNKKIKEEGTYIVW